MGVGVLSYLAIRPSWSYLVAHLGAPYRLSAILLGPPSGTLGIGGPGGDQEKPLSSHCHLDPGHYNSAIFCKNYICNYVIVPRLVGKGCLACELVPSDPLLGPKYRQIDGSKALRGLSPEVN